MLTYLSSARFIFLPNIVIVGSIASMQSTTTASFASPHKKEASTAGLRIQVSSPRASFSSLFLRECKSKHTRLSISLQTTATHTTNHHTSSWERKENAKAVVPTAEDTEAAEVLHAPRLHLRLVPLQLPQASVKRSRLLRPCVSVSSTTTCVYSRIPRPWQQASNCNSLAREI